MKWKSKREELERLILKDKKSYEEIGRQFGVSGAAIKKAAHRLGIKLEKRRKINEKEHFNKGTAEIAICENCGTEFVKYLSCNGRFCCPKCYEEYKYKTYINKWLNGEIDGTTCNGFKYSRYIRRYLLEKNDYSCEVCGFKGVNPFTNNTILQIHHIDGDGSNNSEDNLQVLCPNCHAMTENYGSRNHNATKGRSEYYNRNRPSRPFSSDE